MKGVTIINAKILDFAVTEIRVYITLLLNGATEKGPKVCSIVLHADVLSSAVMTAMTKDAISEDQV